MVHEKITRKKIKMVCDWLEYFDEHGMFPFSRSRVDITLSHRALMKAGRNGRSRRIEELLLRSKRL